jgi:hypothetical protein
MSEETVYKAQRSAVVRRLPGPVGLLLFTVGVFLVTRLLGVDLLALLWPLLILGFGLLLMWPAWESSPENPHALSLLAVPGAVIATLGGVSFLTVLLDHGQSWAYAWLLLPAAVIGGIMLVKRHDENSRIHKRGMAVLRVLVALTLAVGLFLELLVFQTLGPWWPFVVMGAGIYLFVRHQRTANNS